MVDLFLWDPCFDLNYVAVLLVEGLDHLEFEFDSLGWEVGLV